MNTIWSDYIQNIGTLYLSRTLRFSDEYKDEYMRIFNIRNNIKILEIGCGPGALTQSLVRWYPNSEVIGIDRDSAFIEFARLRAPLIQFMEADVRELPFEDQVFDVVISNTVQEHIEPSKFWGEQYRVLKKGGICLMLSARKGIYLAADCISEQSNDEEKLWEKMEDCYNKTIRKCGVGRYAMSESALPAVMEKYGFRKVSTHYLAINLTPDNPQTSKELAYDMINAQRQANLDAVNAWIRIAPDLVTRQEIHEMEKCIHRKYDQRLDLYKKGKKQWDTTVSLTMILRGIK